jgi:hypothetical protein
MDNYYKKKANKYKYKYLKLKELYAGGRKWLEPEPEPEPEPVHVPVYLYHGTSSFYIDSIQKYGLLTKYPEELFKPIKKFWDIIKKSVKKNKTYIYTKALKYVKQFIKRNNINNKTQSQISLTDDIKTAKEYAASERIIGEGPTYFYDMLNNYLKDVNMENNWMEDNFSSNDKERDELLIEMKKLHQELNDACNSLIYSPLILAIKINDIPKDHEIKKTEYVIYESIEADKLYIYIPENDKYIKLNSTEGDEYVDNIKEEINKKKLEREEKILKKKLENIEAYIDSIHKTYIPEPNNIISYKIYK